MNLYRVEFRRFKSQAKTVAAPSIGDAKKIYFIDMIGSEPHGNHWKGTMYAKVLEKDVDESVFKVGFVHADRE